ncbi:MAG TPA: MmgE/PrpD family protein [Candidatus Binatia bacterium]|jgi:2-methylcitrate dehydratase PrpD
MGLTQEVVNFVYKTRYRDIPLEVVRLAQGLILDGLGVTLAGSTEKGSRILQAYVRQMGGKTEATVIGPRFMAPAPKAALVNGAAGHAMDYDDTQLSTSKEAVYGLLTHPTVPVLSGVLAIGEKQRISGQDLVMAYILGVEVECRIADAINPRHYQAGFHSTATIGGLGAAMAVGKLLGLREEPLARTLGLAASMASGLRENFGTMTKPLHAGRAAENGVTAAQLAERGFTSATNIIEAKRGLFNAMAGGGDETKITGCLGRPYFMQEPGISIKPYPSGSLSHPAQDVILDLVKGHDLHAEQIESVEVGTNSNVPNALIYPMPKTALEGKFSIPFCMAVAVLDRKAGIAQFTDRKAREPKTVEFMKRVTLYVDPELEALGYDQVRSRVRVKLKDGRTIEGRADVAKGHPLKPMSWGEIGEKFRDCARLVLSRKETEDAIELVANLDKMRSIRPLIRVLGGKKTGPGKKKRKAKGKRPGNKKWSGILKRSRPSSVR